MLGLNNLHAIFQSNISSNALEVANPTGFDATLLHIQLIPNVRHKQHTHETHLPPPRLQQTNMSIRSRQFESSAFKDPGIAHTAEYEANSSNDQISHSSPQDNTAMRETKLDEHNAMLTKIRIIRHVAAKSIGAEIPFFEAADQSSDICRSLGIDEAFSVGLSDINDSKSITSGTTNEHSAFNQEMKMPVLKSNALHEEHSIGINAMTFTIKILDTSEPVKTRGETYALGTPIPLFDDTAPLSEIGRNLGIDECLE